MDNPLPAGEYADLPIDQVSAGDQPREAFDDDALAELAASIKARGQLQPVRVRRDPARGYVVLAGERRVRACRLAGLPTVRCQVVDRELTPAEVLEEQLAENLHRRDPRPLETARAFRGLMEAAGVSAREVARRLHLAPSTVTRALALLDLPPEKQAGVARGNTPKSAARRGAKAKKRKARPPRGVTLTLRTPKRWVVTVATPRKGITGPEVAAELEALAGRLRAKAGGGEAGPRLADGEGPAPAGEVA